MYVFAYYGIPLKAIPEWVGLPIWLSGGLDTAELTEEGGALPPPWMTELMVWTQAMTSDSSLAKNRYSAPFGNLYGRVDRYQEGKRVCIYS